MRILDRQRYWAFFKAYLICFGSLVGLYVVIDAFTNVDEFTKAEDKALGVMGAMGRYYLLRIPMFYDRLSGVITMLAAIFTVTWMQRNNELLAMLAAGISTHRIIVPVLVSSAIVSALCVANQELVIPRIGSELQRTPDDDGKAGLPAGSHRDVNDIYLQGSIAFRDTRSVGPPYFNAVFPPWRYGTMLRLDGKEGRYIPETDATSPLRGGWLIRGVVASPAETPADGRILVRVGRDPVSAVATAGCDAVLSESFEGLFPPPRDKASELAGETYFLRSNVDFTIMTRSKLWYQFADSPDLLRSLKDQSCETEWQEIAVFLHSRNIRPLLTLTLLCMSLPQVLSGLNKNMFVNLGKSLGTSALFYLCVFVASYFGNNDVLTPAQAAWIPLVFFGCLAASRWDQIRT